MKTVLNRFIHEEEGANLVEYALLTGRDCGASFTSAISRAKTCAILSVAAGRKPRQLSQCTVDAREFRISQARA